MFVCVYMNVIMYDTQCPHPLLLPPYFKHFVLLLFLSRHWHLDGHSVCAAEFLHKIGRTHMHRHSHIHMHMQHTRAAPGSSSRMSCTIIRSGTKCLQSMTSIVNTQIAARPCAHANTYSLTRILVFSLQKTAEDSSFRFLKLRKGANATCRKT